MWRGVMSRLPRALRVTPCNRLVCGDMTGTGDRKRAHAAAAAACLLAVGVLAGGSAWPSASQEDIERPAASSTPTRRSGGSSDAGTPDLPPGSWNAVTFDPDDVLPPLSIPEPQPLEIEAEVVTGPPVLENVDGIVVHQRLAPILRTLLHQAEIAEVSLEGGGYRDRAAQQRLRAQNCPDPVNSPPSSCSPPTARVGESLHEYGLAIDFTSGGELIVDRSHPAYRFLQANADRFGLVVHPREPWHWSFGGG